LFLQHSKKKVDGDKNTASASEEDEEQDEEEDKVDDKEEDEVDNDCRDISFFEVTHHIFT